jgi:uncharacterized GH25 family protein
VKRLAVAAIVTIVVATCVGLRTRSVHRTTTDWTYTQQSPSHRHRRSFMSDRESEPRGTFRIAGRVVRQNGLGVAGADVFIDSVPRRKATTDADGAFAFENLLSRTYEIRATSGHLVGGPQPFRPTAHSAPVLISLREGAQIFVTVVDSQSLPIANARIRLLNEGVSAVTDENGQAKVTANAGWVTLEAVGEKRAPRHLSIAVGAGIVRVSIVLREGFVIRGRVLDDARNPIPGARVYALQSSAMRTYDDLDKESAVTDETGEFIVTSVGMNRLLVDDDEHAAATSPIFDVDRDIEGLEIVMKRGGVYAGRVVDAAGAPVGDARVLFDSVGPLGQRRFSTNVDATGAFEVRGLPPTMTMAYAVCDKGSSDTVLIDVTSQSERRNQKLVLRAPDNASDVIAGVVVDVTGAPVPGQLVNAALRRRMDSLTDHSGVDAAVATSVRTDARGRFSIADLPPGEYGVWPGAFSPQPPVAAASPARGTIAPSWVMTTAKTGDSNVRLVMSQTGSLTGRLLYADSGQPVTKFNVSVHPSHENDFGVHGENGVFDLRDLRAGTVSLRISGPDFLETVKRDVRVAGGAVTDVGIVTVDHGRTVRGVVVDVVRQPVAGARVMIGNDAIYGGLGKFDEPYFVDRATVTDARGAFSITGLESQASIVVGADHPSHGRSLPVSVPQGTHQLPLVTLTLVECGSIAGRVTREGKPVANVTIGAGWPEIAMANSNEQGEFALSRLPAGPVVLRFHHATAFSGAHQQTVNVEAGKRTDVNIAIPIGTIDLVVSVKPKPGHEVAGAQLFLLVGTAMYETYAQLSARLFADHKGIATWNGEPNHPVTFRRIVPGDYTVCAMPFAWSPADQNQMKRFYSLDRSTVRVFCTHLSVVPAPTEQMLTVEVPSMTPVP